MEFFITWLAVCAISAVVSFATMFILDILRRR